MTNADGNLPSGGVPGGDLPTGGLPTGSSPTGGMPTGDAPTGSAPADATDGSGSPAGKVVIARDGDSLCTIGSDNGFRDCRKLRPANPKLQRRPVQPGDRVNVPEITPKEDSGETEKVHEFKRMGQPKRRVWIIQDHNQPTPQESVKDEQSRLAVSNFVPTRQGSGYTTGDWVDHTVTNYVLDASVDPDHFKVMVLDPKAKEQGQNKVTVNLQTEKPIIATNDDEQIERWEAVSEAAQAKLENIECQQVGDTAYYMSCYLRLVIDDEDTKWKRPWGRTDVHVDGGADVSKQTLVTPPVTDKRVEILDLRVRAERMQDSCPETDAAAKCRALTLADVGKDEKVLRIKVYRIDGSGVSDPQVDEMVANARRCLAQMNVGLELVGGEAEDVPVPNNLIAISDYWGKKAGGGKEMTAEVLARPAPNRVVVKATIKTKRKHTPQQTAQRLAQEIVAQSKKAGAEIICDVSSNPPYQGSGNDFGGCDILCYVEEADGSGGKTRKPARIISTTRQDPDQTISDTSSWDVNKVRDTIEQYKEEGDGKVWYNARTIGSLDYRAAVKNHHDGSADYIRVFLIKAFKDGCYGEAVCPFYVAHSALQPVARYRNALLLANVAVPLRTVLTHEIGHILLDAIHTTKGGATERCWTSNAAYDDNGKLAFSEWMCTYCRTKYIHKRISDDPLTVTFDSLKKNNKKEIEYERVTYGPGGKDSPVKRCRKLTKSVYTNLRKLEPPDEDNP